MTRSGVREVSVGRGAQAQPSCEASEAARAEVRFAEGKGEVRYSLQDGNDWKQLGDSYTMVFTLDHFTGCRFGLFLYSTRETGGYADFSDFRYTAL